MAKPLSTALKPAFPLAISNSNPPATLAAITWVIMYGATNFHSIRLAIARPKVTAGLKCPPEM